MINIPKPLVYVSVFGTVCGGAYLIKDVLSGKDYKCKISAADKVVIVTGANCGLGKEAARMLAIKNATVVMACRDMEKCEKVISQRCGIVNKGRTVSLTDVVF